MLYNPKVEVEGFICRTEFTEDVFYASIHFPNFHLAKNWGVSLLLESKNRLP